MAAAVPALSADEARALLRAIRAATAQAGPAPACPRCGADNLTVVDRSSRPYAEWFSVACAACTFAHDLHVPLAGPPAF